MLAERRTPNAEPTLAETIPMTQVPELADVLLERTRITVAGWSMYPALKRGDRISVESLKDAPPTPGEIVVFQRDGQWVCHRVLRVELSVHPPQLTTQGDAVTAPDDPVPLAHVIGRVVAVEPRRVQPWWLEPWVVGWWRWRDRRRHQLLQGWDQARGTAVVRWLGRRVQLATARIVGFPFQEHSRFTEWLSWEAALDRLRTEPVPDRLHLALRHSDMSVAQLTLHRQQGQEWRVAHVEVRFRYRGRGVGLRLVRTSLDLVRSVGARLITCEVPETSPVALRCLQRAGFQPYASRRGTTLLAHPLVRARHPHRALADRAALPLYHPRGARPLTREERVLQYSVWCDATAALAALETLLREPLDWWFVLHQARHHNVGSLLYDRLKRLPADVVPMSILELLQQRYYQDAGQNTRQFSTMARFLEAMRRAGQRVVVLTGFAVAERYYGNVALRPMGDVDFLVESSALSLADDLLARAGIQKQVSGQHVYIGEGLVLELHPPEEYPYYDMRALLERAQPVDSQPYFMPTPEDLLMFLALHMTVHHVWLRLIWLSDLARIISDPSPPMDWAVIGAQLKHHPHRAAVFHALCAAEQLCGVSLPQHVHSALAPEPAQPLRQRMIEWLLSHPPIPRAGLLVMDLWSGSPRAMLRRLRQRCVPAPAFMRQRYGTASGTALPGAYLKRLSDLSTSTLRIVRQALRYLWQDWRHGQ